MPFWGQKQQKIKVRSIFPDETISSKQSLVSSKTNEQIKAARQKIRTNLQQVEKIDETVLEFRKTNELSEDEYSSNLNPLIVYEPVDMEIVEQVFESVKPEISKIQSKYEQFKKNNLTSKYKAKKKLTLIVSILCILVIIAGLLFVSLWNYNRLSKRCGEISNKAAILKILKVDNEDCAPPQANSSFLTIYNLFTFGFEYNKKIDEFEKRVKGFETSNITQKEELKSKINYLSQALGVEASQLNDDLDYNKAKFDELKKQSDHKITEFYTKLKNAQYLDDVLDSKKSEAELKIMENFSDVEKIKGLSSLNKKYDELSTKTDNKKLEQLLKFKYIAGNEWKEVYENAKLSYENVKNEDPAIDYFGNSKANEVAIKIAEKRGFTLRTLVNDENLLKPFEGQKLQNPMATALAEMFKEMKSNNLKVKLLSGFRGVQEQTQIFDEEFKSNSILENNKEYSAQEIAESKADKAINLTLDSIALPGYSRHHFGYTVDLTEEGTDYKKFENTKSYEWMSKDNFLNCKKYGIIPSYPKGVLDQGPEPESWEFVFVGTNNLLTNPEN